MIVAGGAVLGALTGFVFGERAAMAIARDNPCDALYSGEKLNLLDSAKRKAVIEALLAAPNSDELTKTLVRPMRARGECRP